MHALSRLPLLRALELAIVATIVLFTLGSGSYAPLVHFGRTARWLGLLAILVIGVLLLLERRPRRIASARTYAPAMALGGLALCSAAWSVEPRLTAERAVSFCILLGTAFALAAALQRDDRAIERVLDAIVVAAVLVSLGGLVILIVDPARAIQAATMTTPARWAGLGENPNTVPMVDALALPLALRRVLEPGRHRLPAAAAFLVLYVTIVASGSRGAFVAAVAGLIAVALLVPSRFVPRLAASSAVVVLMVAGVFVADASLRGVRSVPGQTTTSSAPETPKSGGSKSSGGTSPSPVVAPPPQSNDIYGPESSTLPRPEDEIGADVGGAAARTLFGGSGRSIAWRGAIDQAMHRPLLGFGFGTEERVFEDRFYFFQSTRPENSYLGLALQVGFVGVAVFVAAAVALLLRLLRMRSSPVVVAAGSATVAGLLLCVGQSYVYSVGNVATVPFWIVSFLLVAAAAPEGTAARV